MTTAERFSEAMSSQWEKGDVREFDHAVDVIKLFDSKCYSIPDRLFGGSFDRVAHKWIFSDGSWAIVADDGSAIYEVGPKEVDKAALAIELSNRLDNITAVFDRYCAGQTDFSALRRAIEESRRLRK